MIALTRQKLFFVFSVTLVVVFLVYIYQSETGQSFIFYATADEILNGTGLDQTAKPANYFHAVSRGTNIQVGSLELHLTTAVHYGHYPAQNGFNVFLNGWVRDKSNMEFKCCLLRSLDANMSAVLEVKAYTYHVYSQWVVDMQNGEFSCSLSKEQLASYGISWNFTYVTFAQKSCLDAPRSVLAIEYPKPVKNSVGICLKISYGSINPELIVEWFEYVKLLGVTRIFTFLAQDLDKDSREVFSFYQNTGFLVADPIHPATSKNGSQRGFRKPRYDQQAWVDEVMAANDCKHRMSGLDYVIVMDIDEFIIPKSPNGTYLSILKETSRRFPKAGTFSFDSHVVALDWNETRKSPLHIMSTIVRTTFVNYGGACCDTRWAFMPHRIFFAQNNKAWERKPFSSKQIPHDLYTLIHRRKCKAEKYWKGCQTLQKKIEDPLILKYEVPLIRALKQLPLTKLLPNHSSYVDSVLASTA